MTLTREQRGVLSKTLNEFVNILGGTAHILTESSWFNRANWSDTEWDAWETWGWYRNFCRLVCCTICIIVVGVLIFFC